ncbi:hypothetical protein ACRALDRAFT_2109290, partial [Sodiomyces alcalophilus JCM 7366]|uniref:uncharacterized protein n=1 Tax=Sodiomyces alcalophilus JCM 7366 TaxID=591952 RepID=UPI0039B4F1D4
KRYLEPLLMDTIYTTNRFKIPLIDIYGVTNIGSIYNVSFALIHKDNKETCV